MPTIKEHSHTGSPTKLSASITENNDNIESWRSKCRWSHLNPEQSQQIIDYCEDNAARESVGFVANASDDVFSRTNERVAPMSGDELYFRPEPEQASAGVTISPEATLNINMRTDRTPVAITSNNAQTFYPPEAAIFCGK